MDADQIATPAAVDVDKWKLTAELGSLRFPINRILGCGLKLSPIRDFPLLLRPKDSRYGGKKKRQRSGLQPGV